MMDEAIHDRTQKVLASYLSNLERGPWIIQGACVSARTETSYRISARDQVIRVLIEHPDQHWAAAFEVVRRGAQILRVRLEGYDGPTGTSGTEEVRESYLGWLSRF